MYELFSFLSLTICIYWIYIGHGHWSYIIKLACDLGELSVCVVQCILSTYMFECQSKGSRKWGIIKYREGLKHWTIYFMIYTEHVAFDSHQVLPQMYDLKWCLKFVHFPTCDRSTDSKFLKFITPVGFGVLLHVWYLLPHFSSFYLENWD